MSLKIEQITLDDQQAVLSMIKHFWGDAMVVVHGEVFHTPDLHGIKAVINGEIVGVLHYQISGEVCEVITLASLYPSQGIGSSLLAAVESLAVALNCRKLSLITTNDNLHALGFYQRRGFHLAALYPGQVNRSRELKPAIPILGQNDIPIRDEIQLEKHINQDR